MYYPKSQIKTNLYTNGDEYVIKSTDTSYKGYYYLTSTGKAFTGKTPDDRPNQELIKVEPVTKDETSSTTINKNQSLIILSLHSPGAINNITSLDYIAALDYNQLKGINTYNPPIKLLPSFSPVLPTEEDYKIGEFRRYFAKKTNEIVYLEINKDTYDKLINQSPQIEFSLYRGFSIDWQLTGDKQQVARTNRNIVGLTMKRLTLPKFDLYLKEDYTKYYQ